VRPTALGRAAEDYLMWLSSHGYAQTTVANRRHHLEDLVEFLAEYAPHVLVVLRG